MVHINVHFSEQGRLGWCHCQTATIGSDSQSGRKVNVIFVFVFYLSDFYIWYSIALLTAKKTKINTYSQI